MSRHNREPYIIEGSSGDVVVDVRDLARRSLVMPPYLGIPGDGAEQNSDGCNRTCVVHLHRRQKVMSVL